jgi:thiamine biosynthesis lipoprotein
MGTVASVTAVAKDPTTTAAAVRAGYARLDDVNRLMSDYRDDSEIGRLNRAPAGQALMVSPETFHVIEKALAVSEASGGAFDVTCRPIVQLWKEAGNRGSVPDRGAIDEALARVGWRKVKLDPATHSLALAGNGTQIDLGAIAKGYALDLAAEAMRKAGATACLVRAGGDVLAMGTSETGKPWRIGIQHPFQEGLFGYLGLTDRAVATSGKQLRFVIIDGKRYSHIVDPRTGRPAEQAPSVTVIGPDGLTADAWATAFSVLTVSEGQALAARLKDIEVLWIWGSTDDIHTVRTPGFDRYLSAAQASY